LRKDLLKKLRLLSARRLQNPRSDSSLYFYHYIPEAGPCRWGKSTPHKAKALPNFRTVFFEPDNPEQLAESIKKVIWNNHLAETISAKAFEKVQSHTWHKRAERILNFIK